MRFARLVILGPLVLASWAACSHTEAPAVTYIVPGGHPGNGGANSWEFWYVLHHLIPGQRYIFGLVRYVLVQRGTLDWSEMLQTGAIAQPDSLVFAPADFNPAGNKAD